MTMSGGTADILAKEQAARVVISVLARIGVAEFQQQSGFDNGRLRQRDERNQRNRSVPMQRLCLGLGMGDDAGQ